MTPEEMKFWLDVLASPAVIAIVGGLMGSLATLSATWIKNRHDSSESEKAWEREEKRRKEERAFQNKNLAYEELINHLGKEPLSVLFPSLGKIVIYGPREVKVPAREAIHEIAELMDFNDKSSREYKDRRQKTNECIRKLNLAIMKDIDQHFDR